MITYHKIAVETQLLQLKVYLLANPDDILRRGWMGRLRCISREGTKWSEGRRQRVVQVFSPNERGTGSGQGIYWVKGYFWLGMGQIMDLDETGFCRKYQFMAKLVTYVPYHVIMLFCLPLPQEWEHILPTGHIMPPTGETISPRAILCCP